MFRQAKFENLCLRCWEGDGHWLHMSCHLFLAGFWLIMQLHQAPSLLGCTSCTGWSFAKCSCEGACNSSNLNCFWFLFPALLHSTFPYKPGHLLFCWLPLSYCYYRHPESTTRRWQQRNCYMVSLLFLPRFRVRRLVHMWLYDRNAGWYLYSCV